MSISFFLYIGSIVSIVVSLSLNAVNLIVTVINTVSYVDVDVFAVITV